MSAVVLPLRYANAPLSNLPPHSSNADFFNHFNLDYFIEKYKNLSSQASIIWHNFCGAEDDFEEAIRTWRERSGMTGSCTPSGRKEQWQPKLPATL